MDIDDDDYDVPDLTGSPAYLAPVVALLSGCPDCGAKPFERCRRDPIRITDPALDGHVTVCGGRVGLNP